MQFITIILKQFRNTNISTWILIILVIVWGILVYVFPTKLNTALNIQHGKTLSRVNETLKQLDKISKKNEELKKIIENILNDLDKTQQISQKKIKDNLKYQLVANPLGDKIVQNSHNIELKPLSEYEQLRRRIRQNTQEMWNYFTSELYKIRKHSAITNGMKHQIDSILKLGAEHKRSLISDIDEMRSFDGYELWRQREADDLSAIVQRRLSYLQNPMDCKNANKIVCNINDAGGYCSELHHVIFCFLAAYVTEHTMILDSKDWIYNKAGWENVYQPVSKTCAEYSHDRNWSVKNDTKVIMLPHFLHIKTRPSYLPFGIPADLAPRLIKLHGDPNVWWMGQFLKYILKPNHETHEMLEICMEKLGWKRPIVGIHIRRTDKIGTEASFHALEEYMPYVEDYYLTLDLTSTKKYERRVFLASDDPSVITEARIKYPQYKIIGDPKVAKTAADLSSRYSKSSLNGIILDLHLLSLSDYLVCTFSSNVCRAAYEIMQTYYPDASDRFKSIDYVYLYSGQCSLNREAIYSHKPRNKDEIHIQPGDLIRFGNNLWDGFSKGRNTRTNEVGLFPSFKVKNKINTVSYPTYSNAD